MKINKVDKFIYNFTFFYTVSCINVIEKETYFSSISCNYLSGPVNTKKRYLPLPLSTFQEHI